MSAFTFSSVFHLQKELAAPYVESLLRLAFYLHLFSLLRPEFPVRLEPVLVLGIVPLLSLSHFVLQELLP